MMINHVFFILLLVVVTAEGVIIMNKKCIQQDTHSLLHFKSHLQDPNYWVNVILSLQILSQVGKTMKFIVVLDLVHHHPQRATNLRIMVDCQLILIAAYFMENKLHWC